MYEPLEWMGTTGDARVSYEGVLIPSGEYVAATYESYAADQEWNDGVTYVTRPPLTPVSGWLANPANDYTMADYGAALASLGRYCTAAEVAAEDLWARDAETGVSDREYDRWVFENSTI